jgi:hypothetical protein
MSDKDFLQWIHSRLEHVHGENPNYDYMHWLQKIIDSYQDIESHKADADSLNALFDMQHGRVREAEQLWRDNNPGNEMVMPDLGKLVQWLMDDREKYKADADRLAEVMKDFAEYGTRHDLNPTTRFGMKEQYRLMWAIDRFRSMDNYVKDIARAALAAHEAQS